MIAINFSVDFELAWGDLARATRDRDFRQKVHAGSWNAPKMLEILETHRIPSTWGIVAACGVSDLDRLRGIAPALLESVRGALDELRRSCEKWPNVLFRPDLVRAVAASSLTEVGSHGLLHLTPLNATTEMFAEDVKISVRLLEEIVGRPVVSLIPPQNYFWPDEAYAGTGIRFVRHTPRIFHYEYSDNARGAKIARLWNDLVRPCTNEDAAHGRVWFTFLRTDRGSLVWRRQLSLLRGLIERREGSLFCYVHPHNLDTASSLSRFDEFCDLVSNAKEHDRVAYRSFLRHLPS